MSIMEQAFTELYPEKQFNYVPVLNYSGRFKGYNANLRLNKATNILTILPYSFYGNRSRCVGMTIKETLSLKL